MLERIQWLGHGSFCLQGPPLIYIDPVRIARNAFVADMILVSQANLDHFSPADVRKLLGPNTVIVGNHDVVDALAPVKTEILRPWHSMNYGRARITAVPADQPAYYRAQSLSYLISLDYYDIYYAGSPQLLPEARHLRPDIAILPVGSRSNSLSGIDELVEVVATLRPRWVIPNHINADAGGSALDVRAFQAAVGDLADVIIPGQVAAA